MNKDEYAKVMNWIGEIDSVLDILEALKPKADAVQPLVGPSDVVGAAGPAALARPVSLTEVEPILHELVRQIREVPGDIVNRYWLLNRLNGIIQQIVDLDQGPIASSFPKQFESQIGKCEPVDGYDP